MKKNLDYENKQVLDIDKMKHLEELGVDTSKASMCHAKFDGENEFSNLLPNNQELFERLLVVKYIPSFTLQDILDLLPNLIQSQDEENNYWLEFGTAMEDEEWWYIRYMSVYGVKLNYEEHVHLIDAAYEMLCWCVENGYVETNK